MRPACLPGGRRRVAVPADSCLIQAPDCAAQRDVEPFRKRARDPELVALA